MNLPAILAGALLVAAPAGYFTAQSALTPADGPVAIASAGPHSPHSAHATDVEAAIATSTTGLIRVRIEHSGEPMDGHLRILDAGGAAVHEETITMDDTLVIDVPLPTGFYLTEIDNHMTDPQLEWFWGSAQTHLEACETASVESLFQTRAAPGGGLTVFGSECMDANGVTNPQRHVGVKEMGVSAVVPYPSCPLQCSMGYSFFASDGLTFEVPEGATSVDIGAHWSSDALAGEFDVWLYKPAEGCGNCWEGIEGRTSADRVEFTVDDLPAGAYMLSAHKSGPVGVTTDEHLMLHAFVSL